MFREKIIKSILLFLMILLLTSACEQRISRLGKGQGSIEIPFEELGIKINSKPGANKKNNDQGYIKAVPPIYFTGEYFYIVSNGEYKRIIKLSMNKKSLLIIGDEKEFSSTIKLLKGHSVNLNDVTETEFIKEKPKFKPFQFDYILDFTPDQNENVYVLNLVLPKKKKKPDIKLSAERNKVSEKEIAEREPKKLPFSRYILKFNKHGDYLYKIGVDGKEGKPFTDNKSLVNFYCDTNHYLYLILKSYRKQTKSNNNLGKKKYELIRYKKKGELDFHEKNLLKYIPAENGYYPEIEDVKITPASENALLMVSFYPKHGMKQGKQKGIRPTLKKLYFLSLKAKPFKISEIKELDESMQYYSILGITKTDQIFLKIPSYLTPDTKGLTSSHNFQVINSNGSNVEVKSLVLKKNFGERWHWFSLGKSGELTVCSEYNTKIVCSFYR